MTAELDRIAALHDSDEHRDDGEHEQDVYVRAQGMKRNHPQVGSLFVIVQTPTACAVGYILTPLRGWNTPGTLLFQTPTRYDTDSSGTHSECREGSRR